MAKKKRKKKKGFGVYGETESGNLVKTHDAIWNPIRKKWGV